MDDFGNRFVWYELVTTDVEKAKDFYTKVMGWSAWNASVPGRAYTLFAIGQFSVGGLLDLPEAAREMGIQPSWIGYVGVNDVDAVTECARRLGGVVHVPPTDVADISRFAVLSDPQAARLAVFKWLRPAQKQTAGSDAPGRVGWHELLAANWKQAFAFYAELFGWQEAGSDVGTTGTYQLFSAGGEIIGGMFNKPEIDVEPVLAVLLQRHRHRRGSAVCGTEGGQVLGGPIEVPGGSSIVLCFDPQGAKFALEGIRGRKAIGYFAARDPSKRKARWSW